MMLLRMPLKYEFLKHDVLILQDSKTAKQAYLRLWA